MALTRKMLKAMGIEEEKIEQIIEAHSETVSAIKDERDGYKENAEKYEAVKKELDSANQKLEEYSKKGDVVSKSEYEKVKTDLDNLKADIKSKETRTAKESAVKNLLREYNVAENRIPAILRLYDLDGVKLDESGNIVEPEKQKEIIKKDWSDYIGTVKEKGAPGYNPSNNSQNKMTKEQFSKLSYKERLELYNKDTELYNELVR